jgi:methionyl-tRNA formyltransferase
MRIVFMGTPDFAVPSLRILREHEYTIAAVVTAPDKPRGRGQQVSFTPIKEFALQNNIPVLQPENLKAPEFVREIQALEPDLIVVVAFRILPREIYSLPTFGSFNLHASLLPKYRGAAPINWAVMNGDQETGVTTFFLQDKVDTGSIILQARVRIAPDETAGEIHDKLSEVGAEIVLQTIRLIDLGKVQTRKQDNSIASPAPKIFKEDCRIQWMKPSADIHNFIRGLSPYPAAWTKHHGKILKIYKACVVQREGATPGTIIERTNTSLIVGTGINAVSLLDIQQEGKRRMGIEEFLRGYTIEQGDLLE